MNILSDPHEVALAANPMKFLIASTGSAGGSKSSNTLIFTAIDTEDGHKFILNVLGVDRTITLKVTPVDSFDWPVADPGMPISDWVDLIQTRIENTYEFSSNFDITRDASTIILTAKQEGPFYDIATISNDITGFRIVVTGGNAATTSVEGILMQVKTYPGGVIFGEDYKPVDSSGHVKFDVSEYVYCRILHDYSGIHFNMIKNTGSTPYVFLYSDLVFCYRAVFYEKISGVFGPAQNGNIRWAIAGALNRESLVREAATTGYDGMFAQLYWKQHFLSWAPPKRYVGINEPVSLFFMLQGWNDVNTWKVILTVVDVAFYEVEFVLKTFTTFPAFSIFEVLAGYTQLQDIFSGIQSVRQWRIHISGGAVGHPEPVSEIRYFYLDETYYENQRSFIFKNSFGVFDSLRCTGKFKSNLEYQREISQMIPDELETFSNAPMVATKIEETRTYKANTGWLDRDYLMYLRDFLRSTEIYEVDPDGNRFKCIITSKKTELLEDKNQNYNLSFEYERAYTDQFYSQYTSHPD